MVKSRSSTSSIFRSTLIHHNHPSESSLAAYDTDSVITFRPSPSISSEASSHSHTHRPPPLNLFSHGPKSTHSPASSLPVTPGTPPTGYPSDPFSHPTTLPEPTRSRPGSLAHTFERVAVATNGCGTGTGGSGTKGPQIVVASPSTSTIHYLFPSPSGTGTHLSAAEAKGAVGRADSRGRKEKRLRPHPADAFGPPRKEEHVGTVGRTTRLASEPALSGVGIGIRESKTLSAESMRTLRRQPSLAEIGSRKVAAGGRNKENEGARQGMTLAGLVEEKKNKSLGLRLNLNALPSDTKSSSTSLAKSDISPPVLSPTDTTRRRSLSLSSPRPAPSIPGITPAPTSPQLPQANFGRPLGIEVGDVISSSTAYTHIEYSGNGAVPFTNPFAFPGGVAMSRGAGEACFPGGAPDLSSVARLEAERRLKGRMSVISESPPLVDPESALPTGSGRERRLSLSGRVRRSLSLKITPDPKSSRRRSQSVTARGERTWDPLPPLPLPLSMASSAAYDLGLGDPSVDMSDRYGLAKIIPSSPTGVSGGGGLGLDVRIDEIGQRSPQRKRIDLGGSDVSLLASSVTTGLGYSSLDSPVSLPESLMEEAVDLTERGRRVGTPMSASSGSASDATSSTGGSSVEVDQLRPAHTPALSNTSTPYLHSSSQMTSPAFPSPLPQTPHFGLYAQRQAHSPLAQLASPAIIHSPPTPAPSAASDTEDHATRYAVTSRKPNLRYSKSFSSDVGTKVSRSFSWRTKAPTQMKRFIPDPPTPELDETSAREKRLSRSFSFATRTRSPVPLDMRPPVQVHIVPASLPQALPQAPRTVQRQPSTGDLHSHRWRPPTLYSLCSPDGAVDPLPTPPRPNRNLTPQLSVSVTAPSHPSLSPHTPETQSHLPMHHIDPSRIVSSSTAHSHSGRSSFLAASTSFRGLTKSLSKSFSRKFHATATEHVRQADSALKARISAPLEATRGVLHSREISAVATATAVVEEEVIAEDGGRKSSKEWREDLLTQAVATSIKEGLNEMAQSHRAEVQNTLGRGERTSWSRSVGKTFGLRSSSSASTGVLSRDSLVGSFPLRGHLAPGGGSRGLKEIGKEESNQSIYSTASFLPLPLRVAPQAPPIHINISQYTPPRPIPTPTPNLVFPIPNFSLPLQHSASPPPPATPAPLPTLEFPSPPLLDLPDFPLVPTVTHTIYRPPTPPSPTRNYQRERSFSPDHGSVIGIGEGEGNEYRPQPLLTRLSSLGEGSTQGKEERVRKVLRWRRDIGAEEREREREQGRIVSESSTISESEGRQVVEETSDLEAGTQACEVVEGDGEGGRLDGMIVRHVQVEKERLRGIVRKKSLTAIHGVEF